MKRIMTVVSCVVMGMLGAWLMNNNVPERAWAGVTCTLPIVLQNGTTADASQVMQNFNQLASCFTNVATVSQVTCGPGLDGGTITGIGTCSLAAARRTNPTTQTFATAGAATYTSPPNLLWLEGWMVGGGGGGGAGGAAGGSGGAGGDTCWGTSGCTSPMYRAIGGGGASGSAGGTGGIGGGFGGSLVCVAGITGGDGAADQTGNSSGTAGGNSYYGGGGARVFQGAGAAGKNNTGGGGQGGAATTNNPNGPGGGAGGGCYIIISNPAASYTLAIGAAGAAGTGGDTNGGAGGTGYIWVLEHYN